MLIEWEGATRYVFFDVFVEDEIGGRSIYSTLNLSARGGELAVGGLGGWAEYEERIYLLFQIVGFYRLTLGADIPHDLLWMASITNKTQVSLADISFTLNNPTPPRYSLTWLYINHTAREIGRTYDRHLKQLEVANGNLLEVSKNVYEPLLELLDRHKHVGTAILRYYSDPGFTSSSTTTRTNIIHLLYQVDQYITQINTTYLPLITSIHTRLLYINTTLIRQAYQSNIMMEQGLGYPRFGPQIRELRESERILRRFVKLYQRFKERREDKIKKWIRERNVWVDFPTKGEGEGKGEGKWRWVWEWLGDWWTNGGARFRERFLGDGRLLRGLL